MALLGLGMWLWRGGGGLFPTSRQLVWRLPQDSASVRLVEIQLWHGDKLLKREEFRFEHGPESDLVQTLPLAQGRYEAHLRVQREGSGARTVRRTLEVGDQEAVVGLLEP